ncbi:MAG: GGDEF domain-containing protein [Streptosporangiales bacterium]|nr:GGDEF domain-containing protein [Streptosporangiales bacterium]MBO0889466.1 GGDEF domain-containing protein [Acidothermales bacterium]
MTETSRGFLRGIATDFRLDLNGVWKLPILFLLPPFFSVFAPPFFVLYWHWSVRRRTFRHRQAFTVATIALGDGAASLLFHRVVSHDTSILAWTGAALVAALVTRLCNFGFMSIVLWLTQPDGLRALLDKEAIAYLGVELVTGIVVALLAKQNLLLIGLAVPPVILLHRGLLHDQLRAMSRTDTKTKVLNAGAWEQDAAMELARAKRAKEPTSVLICDIDHFKQVNDRYGHLNGDLALKAVAQRLQALLRQGDILGRFGGEEFVILLSGIGLVNAKSIAERLRRNVANDPVQLDNASIHLTVSLGVSTSEESHESLPEMLAAADEAMYLAKRRGRDQVIVARALRPAESVELDGLAGAGDDAAAGDGVAEPTEAGAEAPVRRPSGRAGGM